MAGAVPWDATGTPLNSDSNRRAATFESVFVYFFFSSRRRHTRWNCDWSSDVCSSDLTLAIDLVDSSALLELADKAHVDEALRIGGLGARVACCGEIENRLDRRGVRIGHAGKLFHHERFIRVFQCVAVLNPKILLHDFERSFPIGFSVVNRFDDHPYYTAHRIFVRLDVSAPGGEPALQKRNAQFHAVSQNAKAQAARLDGLRRVEHCGIELFGFHRGEPSRRSTAAGLNDLDIFVLIDPELPKNQTQAPIGGGTVSADADDFTSEILYPANLGTRDELVGI